MIMFNHVMGQEKLKDFRNYPIVLTLHFHSLSMPFKDWKSVFSNVGIGLGTEVSHNGNNNWVQQLNLVWLKNRGTGSRLSLNTQTSWRPSLRSDFYSEVKIGVGYMLALRATKSFQKRGNDWIQVDKRGKSLLVIPVGIGFGQNNFSNDTYFSPFVGYEFALLKGYNKSIPVMPQSSIQIGSRVHFD